MWNGIIISVFFLLILFFLGIILTSITSFFLVPIYFTPVKLLKEISQIINPQNGDNVVDLGSGDGRILFSLSDIAKIKAYGYDISPIMIIFSKIRMIYTLRLNRDITFDVMSIFDIPLKKFDIVYCNLNSKVMQILGKKFEKELKGTTVYSYNYEIEKKKINKTYTLSNGVKLFEYKY
ncbi:MAG: hypothetical protein UT34_C0001G0212 [candidate division WS6 bacterium GW2011_GWF2_39_15]|uniref:Methyltransferase domain-containing protein n=1 Tax=candidate division WS6 bacterium GW2011_GWF2_39_15 TaxID=1619100 RepID=A0A0G0QX14_9BACT|nr:MAG: hypothetical protein UT34_C0001G0212 [candidate division WS6 bacterium GW2011_GWF2_39_15]